MLNFQIQYLDRTRKSGKDIFKRTINVGGQQENILEQLKDASNKKPIKTWSRNSTIIPDFVGHSFMIHNGKTFIPITISEEMVGHKLGEFAPTRTFKGHTPADKKAAAPAAATDKPAGDKK